MNSLCGTFALSEPPTNAPFSMRQVLLVSPSQPWNDLPSKIPIGWPVGAAKTGNPTSVVKMNEASSCFINHEVLVRTNFYRAGASLSSLDVPSTRRNENRTVWGYRRQCLWESLRSANYF